jgi:hypothetical protein
MTIYHSTALIAALMLASLAACTSANAPSAASGDMPQPSEAEIQAIFAKIIAPDTQQPIFSEIKKIGCVPAGTKAGVNCDISFTGRKLRLSGSFAPGNYQGSSNIRFVKTDTGWNMIESQANSFDLLRPGG